VRTTRGFSEATSWRPLAPAEVDGDAEEVVAELAAVEDVSDAGSASAVPEEQADMARAATTSPDRVRVREEVCMLEPYLRMRTILK
jgi:hypothetical protein